MAKKNAMTKKRFWEILEAAGYDREAYGYEGVLNLICIAERHEAIENNRNGWLRIAEDCERRRQTIHKSLDEIGYYNW